MYVVGGGQGQPLPLGAGPALVSVRSAASRSGRVVEGPPKWMRSWPGQRSGSRSPRCSRPDGSTRRIGVTRSAAGFESAVLRFTPVGIRPP